MIKENILITGGSGLIGRALIKSLDSNRYYFRVLSRNPDKVDYADAFYWNVGRKKIDKKALEGVHHIVHLAGANIGSKRWTFWRKRQIIKSRVDAADLIRENYSGRSLKTFVSASATGIYGSTNSDKVFTEEDNPANDFTGKVGKQWEEAADKFSELGARVVKIRTPVVLSAKGGIIKKLQPIVKMNLASAVGSGKQIMPWVHIEDLVNIYKEVLQNEEYNGSYNANASNINNEDFMRSFAKSYNKKFFPVNVPAFLLKILFGEMSNIVLKGSATNSEKIQNKGFEFKFKDLDEALNNIYKSKK